MNPSDSVESSQTNEDSKSEQLKYRLKAGAFLTFAGGFGLFGGFAFALAASKKADPKAFDQGLVPQIKPADLAKAKLHESGAALASKALAWGSLYAFAGCGLLFGAIWKLSGAESLQDFRQKAGRILPVIPKKPPEAGERTEFSGINDFLQYIIDKDKAEQAAKKAASAASKP